MVRSFITSFKLKNTYRVNTIIYSIKQMPIIKKILPSSIYKSKELKTFANIVSALIEIFSIFIGKLIYLYLMIFIISDLYKTNQSDTFLHIFTVLTLCGALLNTFMFNPSKDKYYAIVIMNMDAKKYTLSNYYYQLIKIIIGFTPFTLLFGSLANLPIWISLILPVFVVMIKVIVSNYILNDFIKTKKVKNENLPTKFVWSAIVILLAISYGLPVLGIVINQTIFFSIFVLSIILGIYSFIKINNFKDYTKMYKQILTNNNMYWLQKTNTNKVLKENVEKQIEMDNTYTSNKTGFAYFHDLFVKRHKKILTNAVKKQTVVILVIFITLILATLLNSGFKEKINQILLNYLPYFVFIMYLLNRGTTVTQAMFMNCDHSMLTYRVYKTPKVILGLFKERLKTLIKINLLPSMVIAIGLPVLLLLTGGTDNNLNYIVLFTSITAMSIFFSVHNLVMYYLLQPYNVNTEMKSGTYKLVQTVTYFICYYMIKVKLPIIFFGITMIAFSILYCLISLVLAYKYAPKTFKLRV